MNTLLIVLAIIVMILVLFCVNVLACCFALGRMHVWLKDKAEVFGDNEGLRRELADIRGHVIECRNNGILDR